MATSRTAASKYARLPFTVPTITFISKHEFQVDPRRGRLDLLIATGHTRQHENAVLAQCFHGLEDDRREPGGLSWRSCRVLVAPAEAPEATATKPSSILIT
jgi:hypothetical protein